VIQIKLTKKKKKKKKMEEPAPIIVAVGNSFRNVTATRPVPQAASTITGLSATDSKNPDTLFK
jgi:hypothetical protein